MTKFVFYKINSENWERKLFYLMLRNQHKESRKIKKQRKMFQTKEQNKYQKHPNKMERNNLTDAEFKITVIKMLTEVRRAIVNKVRFFKRENIKKYTKQKSELKNIITKLIHSIKEFNSRVDEVEKNISEHEDRTVLFIQSEEQKEVRMKNSEDSLRALWETIKRTSIHITGVPEREEGEKVRKIFQRHNG